MDQATAYPLYAKLVATDLRVSPPKGDTVPYTSLGGHMTSALHKDGTVALRLPPPVREAFIEKYKAGLAAHYGIVQPEYVVIPDKLLGRTAELKPYFAASVDYVASLKPKATTKKPAKKPAKKPVKKASKRAAKPKK